MSPHLSKYKGDIIVIFVALLTFHIAFIVITVSGVLEYDKLYYFSSGYIYLVIGVAVLMFFQIFFKLRQVIFHLFNRLYILVTGPLRKEL